MAAPVTRRNIMVSGTALILAGCQRATATGQEAYPIVRASSVGPSGVEPDDDDIGPGQPPTAQPVLTHRAKAETEELVVTLVRHGQAGPEMPGFIQAPLSPLGHRQARRVGRRLASETFAHIYTSDLSRAHQTAQTIATHHPDTPFTVNPDIREISIHHCRRGPGPDDAAVQRTVLEERERVDRFWGSLLRSHKAGERVLVVCHGSLIGLLVAIASGLDPRLTVGLDTPNTSVTVVALRPGGFDLWRSPARLALALCIRHLPSADVS